MSPARPGLEGRIGCVLALTSAIAAGPAIAWAGIPQLPIHAIQGAAGASPVAGSWVMTRDNVVTAVGAAGFFIQTPDARADGNPDTSEGLFVYTGRAPGMRVGDRVDVSGKVTEFFGFTELSDSPLVAVKGAAPLPAPIRFDARRPSPDPARPSCAVEYECREGMRIEIVGGAVGGPNQRFQADPIGEVHVTAGPDRPFREAGAAFPGLGLPPIPAWDGNPEVFELDPDALGLPNRIIPAGSSFDATGVLAFEFGGFELWPTEIEVRPAPLPRAVRSRAPGEFTIGTLNLLRLFDDVNDPPGLDAQGRRREDEVVSADEYRVRRSKLARAIVEVLGAPDILGVQEAEKIEVLQALAAEIAVLDPEVRYAPYLLEGNDVGTIDIGVLARDTVRVNRIDQVGADEVLSADGSLLHDRPPLLLDADYVGSGGAFRVLVLVVHLRSLLGIDEEPGADRVRRKRLEQAQSVAGTVQAIQRDEPEAPLVVLGDFNAYEFTDGYVDVVGQIRGWFDPAASLLSGPDLVDPDLTEEIERLPPGERYSFVFDGTAQALDHALTSRAMAPWISGIAYGRGNADAALALSDDDQTPLRASDHDGLVLFVMTDGDGDGVPDDRDRCPGTKIPETAPAEGLREGRFALIDSDLAFDTLPKRGKAPAGFFSLADTAGCSCEQIALALKLGKGAVKHGCAASRMRRWIGLIGKGM
jgi:predicted extracellular nuclease